LFLSKSTDFCILFLLPILKQVPNTGEVNNRQEPTRNDDSLVGRKARKFSLSAILVTYEVEKRREKINFKGAGSR
jgi:hypothetical protein